jgi:hypothetical protein
MTMGLKILAAGLLVLGISMVGGHFIPDLVTGIIIIIGAIGVLAGY